MTRRRALITGITGQDGGYLAQLLLENGYEVHGAVRSLLPERLTRLRGIVDRLHLHLADLATDEGWQSLLREAQPVELYHLAAQTYVPESWQNPIGTAEETAVNVARLLEAARQFDSSLRICLAGSSEVFGEAEREPQNESTPHRPRNPYGAAKSYAFWLADCFRRRHGLFVTTAILYNHESPFRDPRFVTRKITLAAARIRAGQQRELTLGAVDRRRDWGFAGDYMDCLRRMLAADAAEDFVVASGETHSVAEALTIAFARLQLDPARHVKFDAELERPQEGTCLTGDNRKAKAKLEWTPRMSFRELIELMTDEDARRVESGEL